MNKERKKEKKEAQLDYQLTHRKIILRSRTFWGVFCIMLAAAIAFIGLPALNNKLDDNVPAVVAKSEIPRGKEITAGDLTITYIPEEICQEGYFSKASELVGQYALIDIPAGDYVTSSKTAEEMAYDTYLYDLPEDKVAISVGIPSFSVGVSGKLVAGDIVSIVKTQKTSKNNSVAVTGEIVPELQYVKVLAVTNPSGNDVDNGEREAEGTEPENIENATITLEVSPKQATVLAALDSEKAIHVVFVCRGTNENAASLLLKQSEDLTSMNSRPALPQEGGRAS